MRILQVLKVIARNLLRSLLVSNQILRERNLVRLLDSRATSIMQPLTRPNQFQNILCRCLENPKTIICSRHDYFVILFLNDRITIFKLVHQCFLRLHIVFIFKYYEVLVQKLVHICDHFDIILYLWL